METPMVTKKYMVQPDHNVTSDRQYSAGEVIELSEEHALPLVAAGLIAEMESKKKTKDQE